MIEIPGDFEKGLAISQWLKDQGLIQYQDYVWQRRDRIGWNWPQDCVIFETIDPQWETAIAMRWM